MITRHVSFLALSTLPGERDGKGVLGQDKAVKFQVPFYVIALFYYWHGGPRS